MGAAGEAPGAERVATGSGLRGMVALVAAAGLVTIVPPGTGVVGEPSGAGSPPQALTASTTAARPATARARTLGHPPR